ncbi:MAG: phosphatase PAP2 family protein [Planctomycetota bacterium]
MARNAKNDIPEPNASGQVGSCTPDSRRYNFIDYATQLYLALTGLIILALGRQMDHWHLFFLGHVVGMITIHLLIRLHARIPRHRVINMLRHFYPVILYTAFYRETGVLNRLFMSSYLDGFFASIDKAIFGYQPAAYLMTAFPSTWISEIMYISYFSYYVMIVGVGLALYFKSKQAFWRYLTVVSFVFYICYLTYIIFPVIGGRAFWSPIEGLPQADMFEFYPLAFPDSVKAGPFFHIMDFIYTHFEAEGAAFPSSHVAVSLCSLYFSWIYLKTIRHIHCVFVILLCISTVYCRYHYVVDVFAGIITAVVLVYIGDRLFWHFTTTKPVNPPSDS